MYAPRALDVIDAKCIAPHRLYQGRNAPSVNWGKGVNARLQRVTPPALWLRLHSQSVTCSLRFQLLNLNVDSAAWCLPSQDRLQVLPRLFFSVM